MSVRVVSKCSLLQHDVAHFCALGRIIGQTEVVLISKDQKDRTVCVTLCALSIETREFKEVACGGYPGNGQTYLTCMRTPYIQSS